MRNDWRGLREAFYSFSGGKPPELEAWVRDIGRQRAEAPWYCLTGQDITFPRCCLQYTIDGEGELIYEGKRLRIAPGQVMLLFSPHDYVYRVPSGKTWSFFYLTLEGSVIERLWRRIIRLAGPVFDLPAKTEPVRLAANFYRACFRKTPPSPWENSAAAYGLAMELLGWLRQMPVASREQGRYQAVCRAAELARARLQEAVGVEDMAREAGMSRYHFSRLFREQTGLPPGEYLLQQRLLRAVDFLQTTRLTVKEVAVRSGFSDAVHFGKLFRARFGLTPLAFRDKNYRVAQKD